MSIRFSSRAADLQPSAIRAALAMASAPGMISFAGGLPATEALPDLDLSALPRRYLQYGPSEGEPELRAHIADRLCALGIACSAEQVLVLSGSQQGIDLVAKLMIDAGTRVAVESPTYLAALQVFRFFGARLIPFGPHPSELAALKAQQPALVYALPTFQNPTGRCYTAAEREALADTCETAQTLLFEDDPYRDLAFADCERTPVCARLVRAPWIYQGSFSKTLAPGLRLGFLAASPELFPHLVRLKQAADLHAGRVSQWLVLRCLQDPGAEARGQAQVEYYRHRRDHFAACLARHFSGLARWGLPPGGLFFWVTLNHWCDLTALLPRAVAQSVVFLPGAHFYPYPETRTASMRLNFSHASEAEVDRGLAVLSALIRDTLSTAHAPRGAL